MIATPTPLHRLSALGQSVWIDHLSRADLENGRIARLIEHDAVVGATSNPTILQQALSAGAYDAHLRELREIDDPKELFWQLASADVRDACDLFRPVWDHSAGRDGYVSLQVDPGLSYDTLATFREARRLRDAVDRPNLMVKIPATRPGLAAFEDAIAAGQSINVTLIFALRRYDEVVAAYLRGLERLVAAGGDPARVSSVASFFVSRIDTEADRRLDASGGGARLRGQVGIANARLAYQRWRTAFTGERWEFLTDKGATPQRVLWASTSVKNPDWPDTRYVEELIGPDTVDTMPLDTVAAYQDHGRPAPRLQLGVDRARRVLAELDRAGVGYDDLTDTLEREGVAKFAASFDALLDDLARKRAAIS